MFHGAIRNTVETNINVFSTKGKKMQQQNRPNREQQNTRPMPNTPTGSTGADVRQVTDRVADDLVEATIKRRAGEGYFYEGCVKVGVNEVLIIFHK